MNHLYGIANCNTVKKARDFLATQEMAYTFHDFKKEGVSEDVLRSWTSQVAWDKLVNKAGMTWRNLSDAEKARVTNEDAAIELMQAKPSVIKRPILVQGERLVALGFSESHYRSAIHTLAPPTT